jgi:catechol 2,3-dioxygenase-like lactoylglutathione lyase family enzyme
MDTLSIHHLGLTVNNLQATTVFFTDCLGWSVAREIPEYPAAFVTNGYAFITLWQSDEGATTFDHKSNVGLHHFALEVASEEVLHAMHKKVADYPGVKMEFKPEYLGEGSAKHCIFYEPGGIRMEFIWAGQ